MTAFLAFSIEALSGNWGLCHFGPDMIGYPAVSVTRNPMTCYCAC